ncbi:MAG: gamma-glutamyltransferase [Chloroflexi bacterium]|nr:gamma-glutamyltransferase [Chloroflexota bacterium]
MIGRMDTEALAARLAAEHSYRPVIAGRRGAVASNHPLATQAGLLTLQRGGSAADAAVAVALTLGVVEPFMSGLGGDGFYHAYRRSDGAAVVVNATGAAPAAATPERFADGLPIAGPMSFTTPGLVGGLGELHRWGGRLPWASLFEAAIHHARDGFGATPAYRRFTAQAVDWLLPDRRSAAAFLPGGDLPAIGTPIRQPDLARTLEHLAAEGADAFYRGALALRLAGAFAATGAMVTADDLAGYRPELQAPIETTYRGHVVRQSPPNSVGWVLLAELNLVEGFDLGALEPLGADEVHLLVEAKRLAFADREAFGGDSRHVEIPLERLLDKAYAADRAGSIDRVRAAADAPTSGLARVRSGGSTETTYFCVVDADGNAVSGIQSINNTYGSGVTAGDTGILLNNRITPFHLQPGHPNRLAPGRRVRHTMNTPMVFRDGELVCVLGTPGGDNQVQVNLQALVVLLDHGWDPQRVAEAPRWAHTDRDQVADYPHLGATELRLESRFAPGVAAGLAQRGHPVTEIGPLEGPCSLEIIVREPATGMLMAGSDPRRDGWALAW